MCYFGSDAAWNLQSNYQLKLANKSGGRTFASKIQKSECKEADNENHQEEALQHCAGVNVLSYMP